MTIEQIEKQNQRFQDRALGLTELMPRADVMEFATLLKRSAGQIHKLFYQLLNAKNERTFWPVLERMEEVMNDLVFELDRLHDLNNLMSIRAVDSFIKSGYDLLSMYSISSDQIVNHFIKSQNIKA